MILYEYPFNERIRTYLRLEHLFRRLRELMPRDHPLDHHHALVTMFEIVEVAARADLKSDALKDIEKQKSILNAYRGNPAIAEGILDEIIGQLDRSFEALSSQHGKAGQSLTDNEWLMSIRSRISIPGGTCEFDLPSYFAWQHKPAETRRADLVRWTAPLAPLSEAISILLKLLRDAGTPQRVVAQNGQFQQNLPQGRTFQLLRLGIDPALGVVPEISGNRMLVSIRMMKNEGEGRLLASTDELTFEMALCA
ncbi:MAG: cell division protein ZapD [Pseudomonadota bacterium]